MIKVRVPATSANMGPGFDTLGIAVSLYNYFGFRETEGGLSFSGFPEEFCNEDNIVYESMMKCFEKAGYTPKGLEICSLEQNIPIARGLGSSSSCIVGGLVGANEIMGNVFTKDELFQMAVEIEGHPDNVAPAMFGGMVVSIMDEGVSYHDIVKVKERIYPIGRLDYDSCGLLLLTNDGEAYNKIIHPREEIVKKYIVVVKGEFTEKDKKAFESGIDIGGYVTAPATVKVISFEKGVSTIEVGIHEGKNRQIRRMCAAVNHEVLSLKRISVGDIKLGYLKRGEWRHLKDNELKYIKSL